METVNVALGFGTDVTAYKEHLRGKGLATVTINKKLVALKQFIDFLNDRFELGLNVKIKQEKQQKQYSLNDEEILTEEDYRKLIAAVREKNDTRTLALFETMYYSGMRVSEVLQLRMDHVNNRVNVVEDIKGKGAKYRKIFVKHELFSTLDKYLEVRKQPFSSTTKALFVGERGPMTRQTAHNLIKKYAKLACIDKEKAHVHNLRHLFGLNLAEKGVPIQDIAKLMGHTSIDILREATVTEATVTLRRINQSIIGGVNIIIGNTVYERSTAMSEKCFLLIKI